jgi:hypothetical protein
MRVPVLGAILLALLTPLLSTKAYACAEPPGMSAIGRSGVIIFGEYHGTNEIPAFFYDVVCASTESSRGTTLVGLELPDKFNAIFSRIGAEPSHSLIARIRDEPFWLEYGDGRHSGAMLNLVERLVLLASEERQLKVVAFARKNIDKAGADFLSQAIRRHHAEQVLILVGNAHARLIAMKSGKLPMAASLAEELELPVRSFNVTAGSGEAWVCLPECASRQVVSTQNEPGIHPKACGSSCVYHGTFHIKQLSVAAAVGKH